jgi:hypothetical protein
MLRGFEGTQTCEMGGEVLGGLKNSISLRQVGGDVLEVWSIFNLFVVGEDFCVY